MGPSRTRSLHKKRSIERRVGAGVLLEQATHAGTRPRDPRSKGEFMRLAGKVAVVTGGGSGIGRGIVLAMAREGADIAIPDIQVLNAEKVADEVKALGRRVLAMKTDVTSSADVRAMVDRTRAVLGRWAESTSWSTTPAWRRRPACPSPTTRKTTG